MTEKCEKCKVVEDCLQRFENLGPLIVGGLYKDGYNEALRLVGCLVVAARDKIKDMDTAPATKPECQTCAWGNAVCPGTGRQPTLDDARKCPVPSKYLFRPKPITEPVALMEHQKGANHA